MERKVDLFWIGDQTKLPSWRLGEVWGTDSAPDKLREFVEQKLNKTDAIAFLFWDEKLGTPDESKIEEILQSRGELWHAGLRLGMQGLPGMIDFVRPTWMLNADPHPMNEATSWRLSLRACLIRTPVLQKMGFIHSGFQTLDAASLELGHRYVSRGVITRNIPWLVSEVNDSTQPEISIKDEVRFLFYRFGPRWTHWALWRALRTGYASAGKVMSAWKELKK